MLVNELIDRKLRLQEEISKVVVREVNEFIAETGIYVDGVYITLTNIGEFGRENPQFVLVNAEVELDL